MNPGPEERSILLTGVNGYKSLTSFTCFLDQMKKDMLDNLTEAHCKMDAEAGRLFIKQAIIRCRCYAKTITPLAVSEFNPFNPKRVDPKKSARSPLAVNEFNPYNPGICCVKWGFFHPKFDPGNGPAPDLKTQQQLLSRTSGYAGMFRRIGEKLLDELHELSCMVRFLPYLFSANDQNQENETIQVNLSVPELSAAFRMFHEFNIINITNKELLCRLVASTFSTRMQKKISPGSLKNHFDSPKPETLERICAGLCEMMKNSQKLKNVM